MYCKTIDAYERIHVIEMTLPYSQSKHPPIIPIGGKLDNDVSFVSPFPEPNLPGRLAKNRSKMLCTQDEWYFDDPRVAQGTVYEILCDIFYTFNDNY